MAREPIQPDWLELPTASGGVLKVLKTAHPRARRLRLTVTPKGARLSYPRGTPAAQMTAFLRQHADWLQRHLDDIEARQRSLPALRVGRPVEITLRGEPVQLTWAEGPYPRVDHRGDTLCLILPHLKPRALPVAHGLLADCMERQIRRDIARWLPQYVPQIDAAPTALRVRPLKSLWGSLDTRDRINLDLALALAPPAALRYVLVHELCHLRVRNHSPRFWRQVEALFPDWRTQRAWLRVNGGTLKLEMERLIADVADA